MRLKQFLSAGVPALMFLSAAPVNAAAVRECVNAKPTAASYTWDFKGEANGIFRDVQSQAQQVTDHMAELQSLMRDPNVSWQTHADQLLQVKTEVNDLGERLCRLETIRRVLAPWQQKMVDQIATQVQLMAGNTQDAMAFMDSNREQLWSPTYHKYVNNAYAEATQLANSSGNAAEYAKVQPEYRRLQSELGIGPS